MYTDGQITESGTYRDLVNDLAHHSRELLTEFYTFIFQVAQENSRFRSLMAAQLTAGNGPQQAEDLP